jgi:hypothetical protein
MAASKGTVVSVRSNTNKGFKLRVTLWFFRKSLGGRIQQEGRKIRDIGWDAAKQT